MNKVFTPFALLVILFITIVTSSCSQGYSPNPPSASSPPQLTPQSSPSNQINMKLQEAAVFLGQPVPVPKYFPEGYDIGDVQVIQQPDSGRKEVDLTITKQNAPPITLSTTWWATGGMFRILPISQNVTSIDISGGTGTYSKWAMLNKF